MSTDGRDRRRWRIVALVVILVLVGAAMVLRYTLIRDEARVVDLDDTLEQFRSEVSTTVAAAATSIPHATLTPDTTPEATTSPDGVDDEASPTVPEPGVYCYHTTGQESVDALGGTTHAYPLQTTITVTPDGCGVLLRWDVLRERREEWRLCAVDDGIELQTVGEQFHEFFGQATPEAVVCDRPVLLVPLDRSLTSRTAQECTVDGDPWFPVWEVLGWGERWADDVRVDTVHVRMTIDNQDLAYWEQTTIDWHLAPNGLPVATSATKRSRNPSPVGGVVYDEEFTLELISLIPLT